MKMTLIMTVVAVMILATANVFQTEQERYDWFVMEGVYDLSKLSNDDANELILEGITSSDERIVERTIDGMAMFVRWTRMKNTPDYYYWIPPKRTFEFVPELKQFLIDYWRKESGSYDPKWGIEPTMRTVYPYLPAWRTVGDILVTYFPEDEAVLSWIWEYAEWRQQVPEGDYRSDVLTLLNEGMFRTKVAQDFRIECLHAKEVDLFKEAAVSLGKFRSKDGLAALASQLDQERRVNYLVHAMIEYGSEALPYMDMEKLKRHYQSRVNQTMLTTLDLLERIGEVESTTDQIE